VSEADLDVVRDQYAAVNERDFERAMGHYADDVRLIVADENQPNPGTYEGREAVGEWFGDWFRTFAHGYRFDIQEIRELRGGLIFMFATHWGSGRLSGAEVHSRNAYLYRVRDAKIVEVGFFAGPDEAVEASSLPEWSGDKTN
jgi:ketosteroid isomerase-like protein